MDRGFLLPQESQQSMPLRLSKRGRSKKTAEAMGDLGGNQIAEKTA